MNTSLTFAIMILVGCVRASPLLNTKQEKPEMSDFWANVYKQFRIGGNLNGNPNRVTEGISAEELLLDCETCRAKPGFTYCQWVDPGHNGIRWPKSPPSVAGGCRPNVETNVSFSSSTSIKVFPCREKEGEIIVETCPDKCGLSECLCVGRKNTQLGWHKYSVECYDKDKCPRKGDDFEYSCEKRGCNRLSESNDQCDEGQLCQASICEDYRCESNDQCPKGQVCDKDKKICERRK